MEIVIVLKLLAHIWVVKDMALILVRNLRPWRCTSSIVRNKEGIVEALMHLRLAHSLNLHLFALHLLVVNHLVHSYVVLEGGLKIISFCGLLMNLVLKMFELIIALIFDLVFCKDLLVSLHELLRRFLFYVSTPDGGAENQGLVLFFFFWLGVNVFDIFLGFLNGGLHNIIDCVERKGSLHLKHT